MSQIADAMAGQFDRLPPHSVEAEMCLLAAMLLDTTKEMVGQIAQIVDRDAFFQADHQIIFDVVLKLYEQNKPIDALILREELSKRGLLEEIGGIPYLAQIVSSVPSAAHGAHYAGIVREKAMLRQLIAASNEILRDAFSPHEAADILLDRAEKRIFEIAEKKVQGSATDIGSLASEVYEMLEDKGRRGIMTGYFELDDMLNGLQNGEMIIVAARPSMGKTAFAMNVIENVATGEGMYPCAVFSLEMSKQQLAQRMLCSLSQIDAHKVRRGMMSNEEYIRMAQVVSNLSRVPIFVDDSPGLTLLDFRAKARRLKLQHDVKLIMIDYMQLMDNPGVESRQQQISEISRGIKAVARELSVPIITLSQLNRGSENRDGHRPRMSDLRESGSIEQDADVIALLHREDYYRMSEPDFVPDNIAEVIIAKQRNGPTGTVKLAFSNKTTRFENLSTQGDPF
jgi:replicative DNA helicase